MKVAVALIFNSKQQILISRRAKHQTHGGCWEFPGGKLEPLESGEQALKREVLEETGLTVNECSFLTKIHHQYPQHHVELIIYTITNYKGEPQCLESQTEMRWVELEKLPDFKFPEANLKIIELLNQLPRIARHPDFRHQESRHPERSDGSHEFGTVLQQEDPSRCSG